jgi:hypothetical protein
MHLGNKTSKSKSEATIQNTILSNKQAKLCEWVLLAKDQCTWIPYNDAFLDTCQNIDFEAQTCLAMKNLTNKDKQIKSPNA